MDSSWSERTEVGLGLAEEPVPEPMSVARVAVLVAADATTGVFVRYSCDPGGCEAQARSTVPIAPSDIGRQVLVVLEDGDAERPIIIGVVQATAVTVTPEPAGHVEIEGKRLRLQAEDEVVLQCGEASITLRGDGRIVIKGMEIVSRAKGTHKVKGAAVLIN